MKVTLLYHPRSEHGRRVEEFAHDIERQQNVTPLLSSVDTPEGARTAQLYDIMQYPAVLVLRDSGEILQVWSGDQLPLMQEVAAYVRM